MACILATATEIRDEIGQLMAPGTRRVAIVAFVGSGASAYIPRPKGAMIVCWPKAGGTTPSAVRDLIGRGANVLFADKVHMKLYWARGRGAIVGSANLSTNALGSGGLKELAVKVSDKSISIDALLKNVRPRAVTEKELNELERAHRRLGRQFTGHEPSIDYNQWFESKHRNKWRLGWWDEPCDYSKKAISKAKSEYGRTPLNAIWGRPSDYTRNDWILNFRLTNKGARELKWLQVDFTVHAGTRKDMFPYEAVQVRTMKECTVPPFSLSGRFIGALNRACQRFGIKRLKNLKSVRPPIQFLELLAEEFGTQRARKT